MTEFAAQQGSETIRTKSVVSLQMLIVWFKEDKSTLNLLVTACNVSWIICCLILEWSSEVRPSALESVDSFQLPIVWFKRDKSTLTLLEPGWLWN